MTDASFPLRHVSIRVPWHDAGWNGTICQYPSHNTACLKLANIADKKRETVEDNMAGESLQNLDPKDFPPCVRERGTFMAPFDFYSPHQHPYFDTSPDTHGHFKPTSLHYPAYAAGGIPFRWMHKEFLFGNKKQNIRGLVYEEPLEDVDLSLEPKLSFDPVWIQDYRNHQNALECFWNHVQPEESLVFFYAKQVPLVEDIGRRILIGVGRVLKIGPLTEYDYKESTDNKIRSLLWERMVYHSIRPDFLDGFLLPYHEALAKCDEGRAFDPSEVVAFAPEDRFTEFSYATEHVRHDAAIDALLACRNALKRANELFDVSIEVQERWIDRQLGKLWKKRGAFPGLGSVLNATSVPMGNFVAQALDHKAGKNGDTWAVWLAALADPQNYLPQDLANRLDNTIVKAWQNLPDVRKNFLQLLSRIDLTADQAETLAIPESRGDLGITLKDDDFLNNPYLIYESTRLTTCPVSIGPLDRGVFPTKFIRDKFSLPGQSLVINAVDSRRLRALIIRELEISSSQGNTLCPQANIISSLRNRETEEDERHTPVTGDLLLVVEQERLAGEVRQVEMEDGSRAYQLERLALASELIRSTIEKRIKGQRHNVDADWRAELDLFLEQAGISWPTNQEERDKEELGRQEKAAVLQELASSRFSVLIGPAGTGKTTLLSVLCCNSSIHQDGILMLAPTGKARVRMEDIARRSSVENFNAHTIAQFLSRSKPPRYEGSTGRYCLTGKPGDKGPRTVIVDECSMLTEEMVAALLESLSGVHRLIFVGDPRQLPPIGAGRPFVDVVARLQPEDIETRFPRIAPGYTELTVPRRQVLGEREDLQLAEWFGGGLLSPAADHVFEILTGKKRPSQSLEFIQWETPDELNDLVHKTLASSLGFDPHEEKWQSFARSLGANLDKNGSAWFNCKMGDKYPGAGSAAERWQILSPVRQKPWGVDTLNRSIHQGYKGKVIEHAKNPGKYRNIPKPMGDNQIVYGDKVINNRNWSVWKRRIYPKPENNGYLANGEIGIVVGHRRTQKKNWYPSYIEIEFSTQTGQVIKFFPSDFDEDGEANLELAYALTVHKAQGSEFDIVFLVLPRSPLMLTRELLYTALTRQKEKVIILHQGSAIDLQRLSSERYSATASRLTNLFGPPKLVQVGEVFLEHRLIHLTSRGEAVRSKSEVIIANLLHAKKIDYHYEYPLELGGMVKYPDFTIEDDDTGITYYWEHCGLLHDPDYLRRWEEKKQWYAEHNILSFEEGGGSNGTLIETRDTPKGGIDTPQIETLITQIFDA